MIQRPRGTRDFSPNEMVIRRLIERNLCSTAISFGYQEVATPTFENAELFTRKSGAAIVEQLYLFRDKAERELVLRPELTAPVIRFYANDLFKQPKPLKLYYFGNCFRYERPQKGRFREFWQFGAELLGTDRPEGIAELIAFANTCLKNNNLKNFTIRVGYLEILKDILSSWEISGSMLAKLMINIDKGDLDALRTELQTEGVTEDQINSFFELVIDKFQASEIDQRCKQLTKQFPFISDNLERLTSIIGFLRTFGVNDITIDLGIARGLDYYTGIVFEIDVPSLGAEKQVCGGGEYSLDEMFNLKDVPCSGFAMGFDRITLAYELEGLKPPEQELDIYLVPLSPPGLEKAIEISTQLRNAGLKIDLDIKGRNMSKNLKFASNRDAKFAIFIGDDELASGIALVRTMGSGEQSKVKFKDLAGYLTKVL